MESKFINIVKNILNITEKHNKIPEMFCSYDFIS